jgi:hypothetical protein
MAAMMEAGFWRGVGDCVRLGVLPDVSWDRWVLFRYNSPD